MLLVFEMELFVRAQSYTKLVTEQGGKRRAFYFGV
jgi:hypothetical protein